MTTAPPSAARPSVIRQLGPDPRTTVIPRQPASTGLAVLPEPIHLS
jgi:hypothetical protein